MCVLKKPGETPAFLFDYPSLQIVIAGLVPAIHGLTLTVLQAGALRTV
jgi:hypothetical protein